MVVRNSMYWSQRRKKQFGRFGSKALSAYQSPSVPAIAKAAWSGVKYLRTLVNSETHKLDASAAGQTVSTTAAVVHVSSIAQGDTASQRTGNSVLAKYVSVRMRIVSSIASTATTCRVMLVIDKQQVGDTAPVIGDILETSTNPMSHYNPSTAGRFQVIFDKIYQFDNLSKRAVFIKVSKNINKYHIRFNGTAGTDIQKNGVYLVYLSSEATNTATADWFTRLTWHDN